MFPQHFFLFLARTAELIECNIKTKVCFENEVEFTDVVQWFTTDDRTTLSRCKLCSIMLCEGTGINSKWKR